MGRGQGQWQAQGHHGEGLTQPSVGKGKARNRHCKLARVLEVAEDRRCDLGERSTATARLWPGTDNKHPKLSLLPCCLFQCFPWSTPSQNSQDRELGAIHNGQPPRVKTVRWERQKTFWKGERNIPAPDEEKAKETKAQSVITTAVSENTDACGGWTPPLTIWLLWDCRSSR